MSRRRGSSRTRRLTNAPPSGGQKTPSEEGFWEGEGPLPESADHITISEDPAAVVRSLGTPPIPGRDTLAEHYFEAVYGRAVGLAGALAAAGDLPVRSDDEA